MSCSVAYRLCLLVYFAGLMYGDLTVSGPRAGYVALGERELRAVRGVPGAFRFSEPIPLPADASRVYPAPSQDFVLVSQAGGGILALRFGSDGVPAASAINGALPDVDWIAFSPSGTAAVLYSSAVGRFQAIRGLPGAPAIGTVFDAAALPDALLSAAISDDGAALLLAFARTVYLAAESGGIELVSATAGEPAAVFFRSSRDGAIADRGTGSVALLRSGPTPVLRPLASGLDRLGDIYPAFDGASVFVTRPAAQELAIIDVTTAEVLHYALPVTPEHLFPLRNRDTFLLSAGPGQPGWVFLRNGTDGITIAIPAPAAVERRTRRGGVR